jgi:hypothetical protein
VKSYLDNRNEAAAFHVIRFLLMGMFTASVIAKMHSIANKASSDPLPKLVLDDDER